MPWHQKAKKDVIPAISFGEPDKRLRTGDFRMEESNKRELLLSLSEFIGHGRRNPPN